MRPPLACSGLLAALVLACPFAGAQTSTEPVHFRLKVLDSLGGSGAGLREQASAINEQGAVVGSVVAGGNSIAAYWSPSGALTLLVNGQSSASSQAFDIDDDGVAIGRIIGGAIDEPFQWTANTGKVALALAPGAVPLAINASQTIVYSFPSDPDLAGATWKLGTSTPIGGAPGDVLVRDINAQGEVTGILGGAGIPARAFRWSAAAGIGELNLPAAFDQTHGNAITDTGIVVGLSRSDTRDQATRWNQNAVPTLLPFAVATSQHSTALGANGKGWVVGFEYADPNLPEESRAVLWVDDKPSNLNALLDPLPIGTAVRITIAFDVNERGQIAARGIVNGVERALRLDP